LLFAARDQQVWRRKKRTCNQSVSELDIQRVVTGVIEAAPTPPIKKVLNWYALTDCLLPAEGNPCRTSRIANARSQFEGSPQGE
jgi:hypothetical protein